MDQGCEKATLLTDLSKAIGCLLHDQIIAKITCLRLRSLRLIQSYLTDWYQRFKVNNCYSLWNLIKCGVPQGSTLGLILIGVFLCYMFFLVDSVYIASYADDTTPCTFGKNDCEVESKLKMASIKLMVKTEGSMKMALKQTR